MNLHVCAIPLPLLLLLSLLACSSDQQGEAPEIVPENVLLITLDTTRADRLGCYGHRAAQTPALDRLAASGVIFEQAFCPVPLTLPAHASLLTGTYPKVHGLRVNQAGSLGPSLQTMAESFKQRGFRTAAFVSAWMLDSTFGLDRGFDLYADDLTGETERAITVEQSGEKTCDSALEWLGQGAERPFFAWVHFFDPHSPYEPPAPWNERLADPYDGEIAFVDSQVERLLQWLENGGLLEKTLVVVAGDHGEAFGEHGEALHGYFIYNPTMRVPLIFSFQAALPAGKVVTTSVGLIDLYPTVMDLMGWEIPPGIDGRSLAPSLTGGELQAEPVYGESEYPRLAFGWAPLSSLTTEEWRYIEAPEAELYSRTSDPEELVNVVDEHSDMALRLRNQLLELQDSMVPREMEAVALDPEAQRRLESLGYVGTSGTAEGDDAECRDPKEMLPVFREYHRATSLTHQRKLDEALAILEPLAALSPESDAIHGSLGRLYLALGRPAEAEASFKAGLRSEPNNPLRQYGLAEALLRQGKTEEAIGCYERIVAAIPDFAQAHRGLCSIYSEIGRFDRAFGHCRRDAELSPEAGEAQFNLGRALLELGRYDDAVTALRRSVQRDPDNRQAHLGLCRALAAAGRKAELVPALRAAYRAAPDDREIPCTLGWLLAVAREQSAAGLEEARLMAGRCAAAMPRNPVSHDLVGVVHARAGEFREAIAAAERALALSDGAMAQRIEARLRLYRSNRPYTE